LLHGSEARLNGGLFLCSAAQARDVLNKDKQIKHLITKPLIR